MTRFTKMISELILAVTVVSAFILTVFGAIMIKSPELLPTLITYAIGAGCVLFGIVLILSVARGAIENAGTEKVGTKK